MPSNRQGHCHDCSQEHVMDLSQPSRNAPHCLSSLLGRSSLIDSPPFLRRPIQSSTAHPLRNPDQRFLDSEAFTLKFASHISDPMEKFTRNAGLDHSDLCAALIGFSLNESDEMDRKDRLQELEQNWAEPLEELEKSEKEAQRLEEALERGRGVTSLSPSLPSSVAVPKMNSPSESDSGEQAEPSEPIMSAIAAEDTTAETAEPQHSEDAPLSKSPTAARSYSLESPRRERRSLSWKKRSICQLQISSIRVPPYKLIWTSSVADLREMCIGAIGIGRKRCVGGAAFFWFANVRWKNLETWEDAWEDAKEIEKIPNRPPLPLGDGESGGGGGAGAGEG
ncbi:hypothetical protein F5887DRAFT_1156647 [Amanita rubescens]|nr:hypothetical protein F5887DRAFT_1156647 [Amanita rubescens]